MSNCRLPRTPKKKTLSLNLPDHEDLVSVAFHNLSADPCPELCDALLSRLKDATRKIRIFRAALVAQDDVSQAHNQ